MPSHEQYMQRCLELAAHGLGSVAPNPMVGCVVVHNDRIIGEGYHQVYGGPHAEVNAIARVVDESLLPQSTLYVNLEPCAHHGKTPPCANLIIEKGIKNVVIGCKDSFSEVSGKGIEKLEKAECTVTVGVLEKESRELNKRFFTCHEKQRPYIILKWAQTQDGFIDKIRDGAQGINWISNQQSIILKHRWRSEEQAILVGANTVKNDNPSLTTRLVKGSSPLRVVVGRSAPKDAKVFTDKEAETLHFPEVDLNRILGELHQRNIQSVIVEGGAATLKGFIEAGLWDEARVIYGKGFFITGLPAPRLLQQPTNCVEHFGDTIYFFRNT